MLTDKDNLLRRLHALRSEHRDLDTVIARITEHSPLDQLQIQRLKKRKLGLKDEIAWLESRLIPDRTALINPRLVSLWAAGQTGP